ncbi:hypothetical protein [Pseudarthrobacter sp. BIM B-2242]|uniref:hypothetical protein n=1 Tax=Pseudarthrobacter sp. BIM B-2242 TaxID=2772401 RepID=UPI00168B9C76|nr:hypothetical protein [Pseudarthrobacter sp. BIM B-2242]QOD05993.1 hypothetical protein IDT60_20715 [Pseudarthrobacter sp. BIM B-2242]
MTQQLTVGQLIAALEAIPGNPLVIIAGFGAADAPGDLYRHRSHINDVGIEVVYNRMNWKTVERFTAILRMHASQPVTMCNPNPATLDSLAWILPRESPRPTFWAVTGVRSFSGHAVIEAEDVAPVQGPSLQRISDEEVLRRSLQLAHPGESADLDPQTKANQRLIRNLPTGRDRTRLELESARAEIRRLQGEIPLLEAQAASLDYLLGITNTAPEPLPR